MKRFNIKNYLELSKDSLFLYAEQAYKNKQFSKSLDLYNKSLANGNGFAAERIGFLYYFGHVGKPGGKEAFNYFREGMKHACPVSELMFGYFFRLGIIVARQEEYGRRIQEHSLKDVRALAEVGDMWAQYVLAMYMWRTFVRGEDLEESRRWLRSSASIGCDAANVRMAVYYYYTKSPDQSPNKAYKLLEESPMLNYGLYRYMIGMCKLCGMGTVFDPVGGIDEIKYAANALRFSPARRFLETYYRVVHDKKEYESNDKQLQGCQLENAMNSHIIVVSGPSGAGKDSVCKYVLEKLEGTAELVRSCTTTRGPRTKDEFYTFISRNEFAGMQMHHEFLESILSTDGNWYGTPIREVKRILKEGKTAVLEIDVKGYKQVLESKDISQENIYGVYITADAEVIYDRLTGSKTESIEKVKARLEQSITELKHLHLYDKIILNDQVESAEDSLYEFIKNPCRDKEGPSKFADKYTAEMKEILHRLSFNI